MKKAQLPAQPAANAAKAGGGELDWEAPDESPAAAHSRPSAPPLFFAKKDAPPPAPAQAVPAQAPPQQRAADPVPGDKNQCAQCGALSPRNYRFCISCGAVLKKAQSSAPAARSEPPKKAPPKSARPKPAPRSAKPPPRPRSQRRPPTASGAGNIDCPSCGGSVSSSEAFCKFCGASLKNAKRHDTVVDDKKPGPSERPAAPVELKQKVGGDGDPFPLSDSATADRPPAPSPSKDEGDGPPTRDAGERRRANPKPEITGKLVVIVEDGSEGRAIDLHGRQVDIGSSEGDIVLAEDRYLSPRHARFFRQEGAWYLRDLSSLNGVYRRLRKPIPLRDGDLVLLGLEVLKFDLVDHAERGLGHAIEHGVLVFGSPATTRRARLCQRTVEGVVRDVYHLVADETTIGRETGDIVFTSDPFMSRRHAAINWDEGAQQYVLADLSSSNGTYLAIRDDVRIENGDFIRLGQHLFRVDLPGGAKAR